MEYNWVEYFDVFKLEEWSKQVGDLVGSYGPWKENEIPVFSVKQLMEYMLTGEIGECMKWLGDVVASVVTGAVVSYGSVAGTILMLGMIMAFYQVFTSVFKEYQVAELGFFIFYLLLSGMLLKLFWEVSEMTAEFLEQLVLFLNLLVPTFCVCVGTSTGGMTAYATYVIAATLLFVVEKILIKVFLPAIWIYVFLSAIDGIRDDERFHSLLEQWKNLLQLGFKILITGSFGLSFIKNAVTPMADRLSGNTVQKVMSSMVGVGNVVDTVWQVAMGATTLLRNTVGAVGVCVLVLLALPLVVTLLVTVILLRGSSSLLCVLQENRSTHCIERVGTGSVLLLELVLTAIGIFLVLIGLTIMGISGMGM